MKLNDLQHKMEAKGNNTLVVKLIGEAGAKQVRVSIDGTTEEASTLEAAVQKIFAQIHQIAEERLVQVTAARLASQGTHEALSVEEAALRLKIEEKVKEEAVKAAKEAEAVRKAEEARLAKEAADLAAKIKAEEEAEAARLAEEAANAAEEARRLEEEAILKDMEARRAEIMRQQELDAEVRRQEQEKEEEASLKAFMDSAAVATEQRIQGWEKDGFPAIEEEADAAKQAATEDAIASFDPEVSSEASATPEAKEESPPSTPTPKKTKKRGRPRKGQSGRRA